MTTATRLLMGTSSLFAEKGRWVRQGAVLLPAVGWEGPGILEPTVIYAGAADWRMWYRGGGIHQEVGAQIGYATSADGITWARSGSNPILGQGIGGEANLTIAPSVCMFGSTYYIYYSEITTGKLKVAYSADGITSLTVADTGLALPSGSPYFGNNSVWLEGSTYYALVEAYITAAALWKTYLASSSSATSGWTYLNSGNPLTSLSVGGGFGGPDNHHTINGLDHVWYHAATSGNKPSDLYRAHSSDRINWTVVRPAPALTHLGSAYEVDQVADPCVLEVSGASYLYYDADDNATGIAAIKLATFAGTLSQLVGGR